jgi:hypothetical protein
MRRDEAAVPEQSPRPSGDDPPDRGRGGERDAATPGSGEGDHTTGASVRTGVVSRHRTGAVGTANDRRARP